MVQHADIDHTGLPGVGGGGGEFAQQSTVEITGGNITTASTTFVDATGLTVTITTAAVRCLVIFSGTMGNSGGGQTGIDLAIDGTRQGNGALGLIFEGITAAHISNGSFFYLTNVLSAASHTFKIQWRVASGTGTIYANTSTHTPARLTVIETAMTA